MNDNKQPNLNLSKKDVTDTERAVALQLAIEFTHSFGIPNEPKYLNPLALAFCNGIAFARSWQKLPAKEKAEVKEYYKPIVKQMFNDNNMFGSLN